MGIPGLTSFIDQNQHLLTDFRLHHTKVIIDGNNLYHFLYYYFHVRHEYGGNYDNFAEKVRYYFTTLLKCAVEPYVIFDGGYDEDDRKLATTLKRSRERIHLAHFISMGQRAKVLPILAYETFRNVLDEMDIRHATCDFEADSEIAALAIEWMCPVMSNDSDFFVYDVCGGFILFDYLNLEVCEEEGDEEKEEEGYFYLNVQIYYLDTLLGQFKGMERELIPLFATLMGNDVVDPKHFDSFFAQGRFPKALTKRFFTPKRQERMVALLMWLECAQSLTIATGLLLDHIKKEQRPLVEKLVTESVTAYARPTTHLALYFTEASESRVSTRSKLRTSAGHPLPYWLVTEVRAARVPVTVLNVLVLHRLVLLAQVEVMAQASAYHTDVYLRQVFYGLLLSLDIELAKSAGKKLSAQKATIEEHSRDQKNQKKSSVEPLYKLRDETEVPYLQRIPHMEADDRRNFFLKTLGVSEEYWTKVQSYHGCFQLALLTVPHWIENSQPQVSTLHLSALIIMFIKVAVLSQFDKPIKDESSRSLVDNFKARTTNDMLTRARDNVCKLLPKSLQDNSKERHYYEANITHGLSQYQACLKSALYLNQLLLRPIPNSRPELLINGAVFYFVCKELKQRKCPELYAQELLVRDSFLSRFYVDTFELVCRNGIDESKLFKPNAGKKKTKRKKGESVEKKEEADSGENEGGSVSEEKKVAKCKLTNKFDALMIDE